MRESRERERQREGRERERIRYKSGRRRWEEGKIVDKKRKLVKGSAQG